ncbi:hypothetical protein J1N35_044972 [Gossypium stocksii]|uniref:Uncharacterized protein n=1 Tax=Gossypium stocksii TaxID=47602 RepID=A0A9D3ZGY0_9ROSI|nr:hypothetical protein J1N35_044972 [Gossypium stocksii]
MCYYRLNREYGGRDYSSPSSMIRASTPVDHPGQGLAVGFSFMVSNPFVACGDGTSLSFGQYDGSQLPFGPGLANTLASRPATAIGVNRPHDFSLPPRLPVHISSSGPNKELEGTGSLLRSTGNILPSGPALNCVEFANFSSHGYESGPLSNGICHASGSSIPWRTKPRARIYTRLDLCIGFPRLPDLCTSNISNSIRSNLNTTQFGSNFDGTDSYIPMPVGTTSWYLDLEATHHVCLDTSALNESTPYSGTSSLLMGDGTPTRTSSAALSTPYVVAPSIANIGVQARFDNCDNFTL